MNFSEAPKKAVTLDPEKIPRHVAIIMDGSGRWAKKRLLNRVRGHEKGAETVRRIVRASREIGVAFLTLYAFSTENWQRPKSEVHALMTLLKKFLRSEKKEMLENNIRLNHIGQMDRLPPDVRNELIHVMEATRNNDGMMLTLALSYGSRSELVETVRKIAQKVESGEMTSGDISEETISGNLYTRAMPDPDLLIRTSGEMRISNYLLWQIAYSEICITDTLWPDLTTEEYLAMIQHFQNRERRFGKVLQ